MGFSILGDFSKVPNYFEPSSISNYDTKYSGTYIRNVHFVELCQNSDKIVKP